jgi:hypothetical protein
MIVSDEPSSFLLNTWSPMKLLLLAMSPLGVCLALSACNGNEPDEIKANSLVALAGNNQIGTPGVVLPESLVVLVKDQNGRPLAGVPVAWTGVAGAFLTPSGAATDSSGRASATWKLGLSAGQQTAGALVVGLPEVQFTAQAQGLTADSVSGGGGYACARTGTTAYCWGTNVTGSLGDGTQTESVKPVLVAGNHSWRSVVAGPWTSCGLDASGIIYCWGSNLNGATGTGLGMTEVLTPTAVASTESFSTVDVGGNYSISYGCGISTLHKAFCWGFDNQGNLGTGVTGNQDAPVAVADTFSFASIYAGDDHTCALTLQGGAYCWGVNYQGTLGPNAPPMVNSPRAVADGFVFQQLAVLSQTICGLEMNGTVDCWGANFFGSLGSPTPDSSATPVPVSGGLTFKQIVGRGAEAVFALADDGRLYYWGSPGGDIPQNVPALYAPTLRFTSISDSYLWGNAGFCGIEVSGLVYCGEPYSDRLEAVPLP